jgi:L-threonylcarbamoyladenylate synthase
MTLSSLDATRLQDCLAAGGVALFAADTVYGLGCVPSSRTAIVRLYVL